MDEEEKLIPLEALIESLDTTKTFYVIHDEWSGKQLQSLQGIEPQPAQMALPDVGPAEHADAQLHNQELMQRLLTLETRVDRLQELLESHGLWSVQGLGLGGDNPCHSTHVLGTGSTVQRRPMMNAEPSVGCNGGYGGGRNASTGEAKEGENRETGVEAKATPLDPLASRLAHLLSGLLLVLRGLLILLELVLMLAYLREVTQGTLDLESRRRLLRFRESLRSRTLEPFPSRML